MLQNEEEALAWARSVGFPVILKASAGGGGRGMRVVRSEEELPQLYQAAHTEAANAFGNGDLYMEKFIERPRHIEFQILADEHGNVVSLGERECSIQRRHQKLIEEAPSLKVTPRIREDIAKTLKRCLTSIGYQNAGTVEFLMDEDGKLYFIEMNTRIQVEHPVTEAVTGIDLVKAQLRIAAGQTLGSILPESIPIRGHSIECRVNAEHPEKFTPSAGRITAFNVPGGNGVRVDTAQYAEGVVPPYYDSLIAKLIVHGNDRAEAMARMSRALEMFVVEGIHTTIPLHRRILEDRNSARGISTPSSWSGSSNGRSIAASNSLPKCSLPRLYPILDAGLLLRAGLSIEGFARELRQAGIRFLQYRDKEATDEVVLERAALLRTIFPASDSCLILNDRVSLVSAARYDGIHVGQEDLSPAQTRATLGPEVLIGVSTHSEDQLRRAADGPADYVAIGPVFATASKLDPDPVVGVEGVRAARAMTTKPLVAIGGITRSNCAAVIEAGADSVAVISDLIPRPGSSVSSLVKEFLTALADHTR